jgi:hypothetical protein
MEIVLTTTDPASIRAIQNFLAQHPNIRANATFKAEEEDASYDMHVHRTPTANFKHFCGPEWITRSGQITAQGAMNRVLQYATTKKLISPDSGRVTWDDELLDALGPPSGPVYVTTLLDVVKQVLN